MNDVVDFVITWVDGNDPAWLKERKDYAMQANCEVDNRNVRFRDWENLKYWFRGVEKFMPWVNNIYFVTYGHLPQWLNVNHPKLKIVKHSDYIPKEYLPTFNSNVIEFYFHRIEGLSDKFVYFNDDHFILDHVEKSRFFRNGLPCDMAAMTTDSYTKPTIFDCSNYLSTALINKHFNKAEVMSRYFTKWFTFQYVKTSVKNFYYKFVRLFPGFSINHLPQAYLKKTYSDVWEKCGEELQKTSQCRFRQYGIVAFWLFRYWQLASGNFQPYNYDKDGAFLEIDDSNVDWIAGIIKHKEKKLVCLNDTDNISDFPSCKAKILEALDEILPEKCSFEL
jgi:hypothetical protein